MDWFVGAMWGGEDQTESFVQQRHWVNGYEHKYQDEVQSMQPGDRIAIKSASPKRVYGLPFDEHDQGVRVMYIKAIGTIAENLNDGQRVRVDWTQQYDPVREWYFYSDFRAVWRVEPGDWRANALIAFTFDEEPQDIDRFKIAYPPRGRGADATDTSEDGQNNGPADGKIINHLPGFPEIYGRIADAGRFPIEIWRQLHLGLWANERRHFAVLTGISGSGKTLLAYEYGKALTGGLAPYFCVIPVQPGWTDPSFLLGYPNPLQRNSYERTRFLELLLSAESDPATPHVVILDEMNLSHPEQYLAPVLSAMETGNQLELHGREDDFDGVPRSIHYPGNLVLIGTVNMDETTTGLSDKVLDRAFTLEFWYISVDDWPGWGSHDLSEDQEDQVKRALRELMDALNPAKLHFGYRVIDEVVAFLNQRNIQTPDWDFTSALDSVVYAKVLPKLRGDDSTRFRTALEKCVVVLQEHSLERCVAKVEDLKNDLEFTGSARFWR